MRESLLIPGPAILKALTGFENAEVIPLPPRIRKTVVEKETDSLYTIKIPGKKDFILHLEYQTSNDYKMIQRMAAYDYMTLLRYNMDVVSSVIYIGNEKLSMKNRLLMGDSIYVCKMMDIRNLDPQLFIKSNNPREVILSILAGDKGKEGIIKEVLIKLQLLITNSESELVERIQEMEILSGLRGKHIQNQILKLENHMPTLDEIIDDLRVKQGKMEIQKIASNMIKEGLAMPLIRKYTRIPVRDLNRLAKKMELNKSTGINKK